MPSWAQHQAGAGADRQQSCPGSVRERPSSFVGRRSLPLASSPPCLAVSAHTRLMLRPLCPQAGCPASVSIVLASLMRRPKPRPPPCAHRSLFPACPPSALGGLCLAPPASSPPWWVVASPPRRGGKKKLFHFAKFATKEARSVTHRKQSHGLYLCKYLLTYFHKTYLLTKKVLEKGSIIFSR